MESYVEGKSVVITGGSSGFGLETARILLQRGAKVVITGRSKERLDQAVDELKHKDLLAVVADATRTEDWAPPGVVVEGDVRKKMHAESSPFEELYNTWDGTLEPDAALDPLRRLLADAGHRPPS